jgi:hypothetical protein
MKAKNCNRECGDAEDGIECVLVFEQKFQVGGSVSL